MKYHSITLWKTGLINSIVADSHSNTRFVKVVQNSPCVRELWCSSWTDNARSSCHILWERGILGYFFHQHAKDFFSLAPAKFDNRSKKVRVEWCKEIWKNTIVVLQKTFIRSSQRTNHGSMRISPNQNKNPPCGSSKTSHIQRKLFLVEALRSRWSPVSSAKLIMWSLFHLNIVYPVINVIENTLNHHGNFRNFGFKLPYYYSFSYFYHHLWIY